MRRLLPLLAAAVAAVRHTFGTVGIAEAQSYGCTNYGSLWGLPLFVGRAECDAPIVICRWRPAEAVLPWLSVLSVLVTWLATGREEFAIFVGPALASENSSEVAPC